MHLIWAARPLRVQFDWPLTPPQLDFVFCMVLANKLAGEGARIIVGRLGGRNKGWQSKGCVHVELLIHVAQAICIRYI